MTARARARLDATLFMNWCALPLPDLEIRIEQIRRAAVREHFDEAQWEILDRMRRRLQSEGPRRNGKAGRLHRPIQKQGASQQPGRPGSSRMKVVSDREETVTACARAALVDQRSTSAITIDGARVRVAPGLLCPHCGAAIGAHDVHDAGPEFKLICGCCHRDVISVEPSE